MLINLFNFFEIFNLFLTENFNFVFFKFNQNLFFNYNFVFYNFLFFENENFNIHDYYSSFYYENSKYFFVGLDISLYKDYYALKFSDSSFFFDDVSLTSYNRIRNIKDIFSVGYNYENQFFSNYFSDKFFLKKGDIRFPFNYFYDISFLNLPMYKTNNYWLLYSLNLNNSLEIPTLIDYFNSFNLKFSNNLISYSSLPVIENLKEQILVLSKNLPHVSTGRNEVKEFSASWLVNFEKYIFHYINFYGLKNKDIFDQSNFRYFFISSNVEGSYSFMNSSHFDFLLNIYVKIKKNLKYFIFFVDQPLDFGFQALNYYGYSFLDKNFKNYENGLVFEIVNYNLFDNLLTFSFKEKKGFLNFEFLKHIHLKKYYLDLLLNEDLSPRYMDVWDSKSYLYGLNRYYSNLGGRLPFFSKSQNFDLNLYQDEISPLLRNLFKTLNLRDILDENIKLLNKNYNFNIYGVLNDNKYKDINLSSFIEDKYGIFYKSGINFYPLNFVFDFIGLKTDQFFGINYLNFEDVSFYEFNDYPNNFNRFKYLHSNDYFYVDHSKNIINYLPNLSLEKGIKYLKKDLVLENYINYGLSKFSLNKFINLNNLSPFMLERTSNYYNIKNFYMDYNLNNFNLNNNFILKNISTFFYDSGYSTMGTLNDFSYNFINLLDNVDSLFLKSKNIDYFYLDVLNLLDSQLDTEPDLSANDSLFIAYEMDYSLVSLISNEIIKEVDYVSLINDNYYRPSLNNFLLNFSVNIYGLFEDLVSVTNNFDNGFIDSNHKLSLFIEYDFKSDVLNNIYINLNDLNYIYISENIFLNNLDELFIKNNDKLNFDYFSEKFSLNFVNYNYYIGSEVIESPKELLDQKLIKRIVNNQIIYFNLNDFFTNSMNFNNKIFFNKLRNGFFDNQIYLLKDQKFLKFNYYYNLLNSNFFYLDLLNYNNMSNYLNLKINISEIYNFFIINDIIFNKFLLLRKNEIDFFQEIFFFKDLNFLNNSFNLDDIIAKKSVDSSLSSISFQSFFLDIYNVLFMDLIDIEDIISSAYSGIFVSDFFSCLLNNINVGEDAIEYNTYINEESVITIEDLPLDAKSFIDYEYLTDKNVVSLYNVTDLINKKYLDIEDQLQILKIDMDTLNSSISSDSDSGTIISSDLSSSASESSLDLEIEEISIVDNDDFLWSVEFENLPLDDNFTLDLDLFLDKDDLLAFSFYTDLFQKIEEKMDLEFDMDLFMDKELSYLNLSTLDFFQEVDFIDKLFDTNFNLEDDSNISYEDNFDVNYENDFKLTYLDDSNIFYEDDFDLFYKSEEYTNEMSRVSDVIQSSISKKEKSEESVSLEVKQLIELLTESKKEEFLDNTVNKNNYKVIKFNVNDTLNNNNNNNNNNYPIIQDRKNEVIKPLDNDLDKNFLDFNDSDFKFENMDEKLESLNDYYEFLDKDDNSMEDYYLAYMEQMNEINRRNKKPDDID